MNRRQLVSTLCGILVLLWAYAAMIKLIHFQQFQGQMAMQVLPDFLKALLSLTLPEFELILAIVLCTERLRIIGLYISVILLVAFSAYVGLAVFKVFPKRPCSCGGIFEHVGWPGHFAINLFFTAINIITINMTKRKEAPALKSLVQGNG